MSDSQHEVSEPVQGMWDMMIHVVDNPMVSIALLLAMICGTVASVYLLEGLEDGTQ